MSVDKIPSIVIDNGSGWIKAGFAQQDLPSSVFPSVIGRSRIPGLVLPGVFKDKYCGNEAISKRGVLSLRFPIEHGIVNNWNDMETLWRHTFYEELRVSPEEHSVLLTETPLNPRANREKMTQIMFETFNVPFLHICSSPLLALFGSGRDTGLVIDSGERVTHTVPVFKGLTLTEAVLRLDIGGRDVTEYLTRIFCERGYAFSTSSERKQVHDIKEKLGFVSTDYERDMDISNCCDEFERQYELPDGQIVTLGNERFRCIEPFFSPSLLGMSSSGIPDLASCSIMKCDIGIRARLYGNIVLSGGNTMFPGMRDRVHKEMDMLSPPSMKLGVVSPPEGKYSSWIGGALVAGSDQFEGMCMRRLEDYEELGPSIVHRKCL